MPTRYMNCEYWFCPKTFHWKNAYTIHELTHEKNRTFPCVECGRVLQNEYFLKKHLKKHQNKRDSYCVECDVHFVNLTALRGHYATVARHRQPEALTFSCDKCPKRYETEKELSRHVQNFHERVARFSCEKCGQGYATRTGLLHHTKKAHLGYKLPLKYTCIECDKSFTTKTQLTAHMRKHTGEQPFQCDQCLRKFSQRSSMRTHIKLVHLKMKRNRSGKGNPWGTLPNTDSIQEKDDSVQDSSVVQLNVDKFSADNIMKDETGIR